MYKTQNTTTVLRHLHMRVHASLRHTFHFIEIEILKGIVHRDVYKFICFVAQLTFIVHIIILL